MLACLSALLFGGLAVAIRLALRRSPDPELGAVVSTVVALGLSLVAGATAIGDATAREAVPFFFAGMIAPGASQILFFTAVRDLGSARTAVLVGTAPLFSAVLAVAWLGEPLELALALATFLIVSGGILLAGERMRPEHFRAVGAVLTLSAAVLFAARDSLLRRLAIDTDTASSVACLATLLGGLAVIVAYLLVSRRGRRALAGSAMAAWIPAGLLFGLSYVALFEAYYRGRVTVVSPLIATESLWGVVLSALVLRRSELVGPRLLAGALLVVSGGALIGATR